MNDGFESLVEELRPRLARAFAAAYGLDRGQEALAEAFAWAWEHAEEVMAMDNPGGYLYRVGQSRSRDRRRQVGFPAPGTLGMPDIEPALPVAWATLSERQRLCVALVSAGQWSHQEVADLLGIGRSSVQVHVDRGLAKLRSELGVSDDVRP